MFGRQSAFVFACDQLIPSKLYSVFSPVGITAVKVPSPLSVKVRVKLPGAFWVSLSMVTSPAVSYTHLDVYKRQSKSCG